MFRMVEKLVKKKKKKKKKKKSLSLKATLEIFFSISYYETWQKPLTGDLILSLWRF